MVIQILIMMIKSYFAVKSVLPRISRMPLWQMKIMIFQQSQMFSKLMLL